MTVVLVVNEPYVCSTFPFATLPGHAPIIVSAWGCAGEGGWGGRDVRAQVVSAAASPLGLRAHAAHALPLTVAGPARHAPLSCSCGGVV